MCENIVFFCFFGSFQWFFGFFLVFIGFSMVLARFFNEIIVFSMVLFGFSLVSFGFSLELVVFITRVHSFFGFIMAVLESHLVSIGFTMGLARVYCSRLQCFLSLAHSGEGGGSSPEMPQTLQSSKKLQNECFSKLFVRVSGCGSACVSSPRRSGAPKSFKTIAFSMLFAWVFGCESWGCSGALISVFSFHARNEEDNDSVWIALGVSFSGYLSFHARNEEMIVSGLLWECHFLAISPFTCVMRRT